MIGRLGIGWIRSVRSLVVAIRTKLFRYSSADVASGSLAERGRGAGVGAWTTLRAAGRERIRGARPLRATAVREHVLQYLPAEEADISLVLMVRIA
jgi:hypothetical protein